MTTMTIEHGGTLTLPAEVQQQYGMLPETSVRLIETRGGLLLVPLTSGPMSEELAAELAEWQMLGQDAWVQFSYEDDAI